MLHASARAATIVHVDKAAGAPAAGVASEGEAAGTAGAAVAGPAVADKVVAIRKTRAAGCRRCATSWTRPNA
jgi:hypothetical protein